MSEAKVYSREEVEAYKKEHESYHIFLEFHSENDTVQYCDTCRLIATIESLYEEVEELKGQVDELEKFLYKAEDQYNKSQADLLHTIEHMEGEIEGLEKLHILEKNCKVVAQKNEAKLQVHLTELMEAVGEFIRHSTRPMLGGAILVDTHGADVTSLNQTYTKIKEEQGDE